MRLWRAIRNHRKNVPNYITEQQQTNHPLSNEMLLEELNRNEINRNVYGQLGVGNASATGRRKRNCPSVPEIIVPQAQGSNCNSFDSQATTSSEDYESCNGGHTTGDERMDM